ncbi:unnamed protein product [Heterobilharzia americana]|nr:unnamed protein product [Heterobilharzia americana]
MQKNKWAVNLRILFFSGNLENLKLVLSPSSKEEKFVAFMGYGCIIGAWLSAGFLILDWDRPWQAWPIPCVVGAFLGVIVGLLAFKLTPLLSYLLRHRVSSSSKFRTFPQVPTDNKYRCD